MKIIDFCVSTTSLESVERNKIVLTKNFDGDFVENPQRLFQNWKHKWE